MREDEEHAEPIMRHEPDVPRVFDEAGRYVNGRCAAVSRETKKGRVLI
jgi:hypothetical protein